MTHGYTRPARQEDIPVLAATLREADVSEIKASSGLTPGEALYRGMEKGPAYVACLPNGTPVCIYGIVPMSTQVGGIWMVASKQFHLVHRQFLRECKGVLEEITRDYRMVFNFTDARNHVHHRWIKWMGFTIIKRHESYGHEGRPFLEFVKITENNHV